MLTLIFLDSLRGVDYAHSPCPMVPQFSPGAPGFSELEHSSPCAYCYSSESVGCCLKIINLHLAIPTQNQAMN